jgi:hypothetical protein
VSAPIEEARAELAASAAGFAPAGLGARAAGFALDAAVAVLILQLFAPAAYQASLGRVQLLNAPFGAERCEPASASASTAARAAGPRLCRRTLFGRPFASAAMEGALGGATIPAGPVDLYGRPVAPIDLGWLAAPVFATLRLLLEAVGWRSPGRAAFGARLMAERGGLSSGMLVRRYGALIGPFLLICWAAAATIRFAPQIEATAVATAALGVAFVYGGACLAVLRARAPFHDRAAGTRVVTTRS